MLKKKITTALAMLFMANFMVFAQEESGLPDPGEMVEKELERLEVSLKLDDVQMFYADSILTTNITGMVMEIAKMQRSRIENIELYRDVQDKWNEATEAAFQKLFTAKQWDAYLKSGAQSAIKERERRRAKEAEAMEKLKKKKK